MDYKNFVYKDDAFKGFTELRKVVNEIIENGKSKKKFEDAFDEIGTLAMEGNPIAQDVMSYYYKNGVKGLLKPNYDLYMKWSILAAANGNEFAIEKLQFFLNYAFTEIAETDDLEKIIENNDVDEKNYVYVFGNVICEGLVDELGITAQKLVEEDNDEEVLYTPEKLRVYRRAMEKVLPKVLEFLLV